MDDFFKEIIKSIEAIEKINEYEKIPFEERNIAAFESENFCIDTSIVNDNGNAPYETAICHVEYNECNWIPIEHYKTKEKAIEGHNRWLEIFKSNNLPDVLIEDTPDLFKDLIPKRAHKRRVSHE